MTAYSDQIDFFCRFVYLKPNNLKGQNQISMLSKQIILIHKHFMLIFAENN